MGLHLMARKLMLFNCIDLGIRDRLMGLIWNALTHEHMNKIY